ncbi:uncharacterized protein EI90DRAFT_3080477 [Cantharellus anzutake]|uniref:uncharacterized protein n=1 Tax=Cantharellus anzutake TaxID=1750568 RepID=UPI00190625D2|nr:uncharacterized protein EI90DRAFT_3080477 [Cantharellus anzutake]KAF8320522.1 hypothetical protein EI90DRAFT_3080477 [Cantharellus anzutake]
MTPTPKNPDPRSGSPMEGDTTFNTSIPGFPIQDDARSVRTSNSLKRSGTASKDYWMDDDLCKECYDCKSTFTAWRRKHHCRICGQIYCSRCASNIIKGARFGQDGLVRICNICLKMLEDDNYDDEDDRRSIASANSSPFPAHQLGNLQNQYPQSPYAAQNLLAQSHDSYNLFSIPELHRRFVPDTNNPLNWDGADATAAPFRRNLEDEKDVEPRPGALEEFAAEAGEAGGAGPKGNAPQVPPMIQFPSQEDKEQSFIHFPGSSSPDRADSPRPLRSRVSSFATDADLVGPPFLRSRVASRLTALDIGEPGWRTRRESSAYAAELNGASMFHLRILLRQLLDKEGIQKAREWEETLMKLCLRFASHFSVNARLPGGSMDVRRNIKIKKLPGGLPRDSEYVDGAVITKNVAHKTMFRDIRNPRIMIVTFPFDYHRVEGQFMAFEPLLSQEKDYLQNLISRVAALRPHLVLVERSVSRLALDNLLRANIAVARTVKNSALQFVAKATQGHVLTSMDRLVTEPQMGQCARFRIQTFDHHLIPGRRKTYMRFEGCGNDTACTVILRGENLETLKKIKAVTGFLMFAVRNLKMETFLWKDTVISMPPMPTDAAPQSFVQLANRRSENVTQNVPGSGDSSPNSSARDGGGIESLVPAVAASDASPLSPRIQPVLSPYLINFVSISSTLRFPPPYPIWKMKEFDDLVGFAKKEWEEEEASRILQEETERSRALSQAIVLRNDDAGGLDCEDLPKTPQPRRAPSITPDDTTPSIETRALPRTESKASLLSGCGSSAMQSLLLNPTLVSLGAIAVVRDVSCITKLSALHQARTAHEEFKRIWEWYLRKNPDDFAIQKYQCIHVRHFVIPTLGMDPEPACFQPKLIRISYYGENDCTLGQFIEDSIMEFLDPKKLCQGKGCRKHLGAHSKVYVHHESRVVVATEPWTPTVNPESSIPSPDKIASFSVCRKCFQTTPFIPISDETLKYSFGKFLELHFYPADVSLIHGAGCEHNIYLHHIRYFAWRGMTVRFQTEPVGIYEVVFPSMRTTLHMESLLTLKNRDYEWLLLKNAAYWDSVVSRITELQAQAAFESTSPPESSKDSLVDEGMELLRRVKADRDEASRIIQDAYASSFPVDTLALGGARSFIQNKVVQWDLELERLEKKHALRRPRMLSEKDFRRMTGSHHFKRLYDDFFRQPKSAASEIDEKSTNEPDAPISESESMEEKLPVSEDAGLPGAVLPVVGDVLAPVAKPLEEGDSDSTISAPRTSMSVSLEIVPSNDRTQTMPSRGEAVQEASNIVPSASRPPSRLPRWQGNAGHVADLVKHFQPSNNIEHSTTLMDFPPSDQTTYSDSEAPYNPIPKKRIRVRSTGAKGPPPQESGGSDYERSYAANLGPRHLAQSKRAVGKLRPPSYVTRIPPPLVKRTPLPAYSDEQMSSNVLAPIPAERAKGRKSDEGSKARAKNCVRPPLKAHGSNRVLSRPSPRPPGSASSGQVHTLTRQFERISKDNAKKHAIAKTRRARPVATTRAKVAFFSSIREAPLDESEDDDEVNVEADDEGDGGKNSMKTPADNAPEAPASVHSSTESVSGFADEIDAKPASSVQDVRPVDENTLEPEAVELSGADVTEDLPRPMSPSSQRTDPSVPSKLSETQDTGPSSSAEGSTVMSTVSGWWRGTNNATQLQYPFGAAEHMFADNPITLREDEPTSIIAFTLNSKDHRQAISKAQAERKAKTAEHSETFMPDDSSDSRSTWGLINSEDAPDPSELMKHPTSVTHLSFQFESGGIAISCAVFCAEQFELLRRSCGCEDLMIESLARCHKWDATGGKSGSAFLKSRDERFIAKEITKSELDDMTKFAPAYFDYMSNAISSNRPTLLSKIYGCYKVIYKNPVAGKTIRMNLLVMENLFYGRKFSKIYDLKGSLRNRHVRSTGRENEVLLDENLVQMSHLDPFYVREHSKRILRGALWNDSRFLANLNIMDYSVIVAADCIKNELVVGIVDFIRTYTWDKKLETWVKESAFLGGAAKGEPTIITPKQYKARFRSAMERYFPLVPDRWTKQQYTPDDEGDGLLEMWPDW